VIDAVAELKHLANCRAFAMWITVRIVTFGIMFIGMITNVRANENELQWNGQVISFVFDGQNKDGDFNWMISQDQYRDALFVFNDNEDQYYEHRDHPTEVAGAGCLAGGGNAIIRPYQCRTPPRSIGIPTGPNYSSLTPDVKRILDEAIDNVHHIASKENYRRIFYNAANASGDLGTHIFPVGEEVKQYIVTKLKAQ
jgi:hypothetical protein